MASDPLYRFTDDRLRLRTVSLQIGNGVQTGELGWQRIGETSWLSCTI
jgi:hypothetical protein